MNARRKILLGVAGAALAAVQVISFTVRASSSTMPDTTTIQQKLVVQDLAHDCGNKEIILDPNRAPMWWVNCGGAQSGGEPVCVIKTQVINGKVVLVPDICIGGPPVIYPDGSSVPAELTMWLNGKPVTLTVTQLFWVEHWLARRGVR